VRGEEKNCESRDHRKVFFVGFLLMGKSSKL
jgi:hypothetical protein